MKELDFVCLFSMAPKQQQHIIKSRQTPYITDLTVGEENLGFFFFPFHYFCSFLSSIDWLCTTKSTLTLSNHTSGSPPGWSIFNPVLQIFQQCAHGYCSSNSALFYETSNFVFALENMMLPCKKAEISMAVGSFLGCKHFVDSLIVSKREATWN